MRVCVDARKKPILPEYLNTIMMRNMDTVSARTNKNTSARAVMSFGHLLSVSEFPFYKLHETLSRFLAPFREDHIDHLLESNAYESFVATLCIGIICATKVARTNLYGMLNAYLVTIRRHSRHNRHRPLPSQSQPSWWSVFIRRATSRLEIRQQMLDRVDDFVRSLPQVATDDDYTSLQASTDALFNEGVGPRHIYHEYYISYLALIIASYAHFMDKAMMTRAVRELVDFHIYDSHCFYDNYDSDVMVSMAD